MATCIRWTTARFFSIKGEESAATVGNQGSLWACVIQRCISSHEQRLTMCVSFQKYLRHWLRRDNNQLCLLIVYKQVGSLALGCWYSLVGKLIKNCSQSQQKNWLTSDVVIFFFFSVNISCINRDELKCTTQLAASTFRFYFSLSLRIIRQTNIILCSSHVMAADHVHLFSPHPSHMNV